MKTAATLLLCVLSISTSWVQDIDLKGTWTMFEMVYVNAQGRQTMTEDQMKADSAVTDYFFMEDGKFKLTSNMSGSGTMDTYEGTWKLADGNLILSLNIGGQVRDVVWSFEYKDEAMNLSRTSPDGSLTIVNSFRRR